jgi:hypothetical protein
MEVALGANIPLLAAGASVGLTGEMESHLSDGWDANSDNYTCTRRR